MLLMLMIFRLTDYDPVDEIPSDMVVKIDDVALVVVFEKIL